MLNKLKKALIGTALILAIHWAVLLLGSTVLGIIVGFLAV